MESKIESISTYINECLYAPDFQESIKCVIPEECIRFSNKDYNSAYILTRDLFFMYEGNAFTKKGEKVLVALKTLFLIHGHVEAFKVIDAYIEKLRLHYGIIGPVL